MRLRPFLLVVTLVATRAAALDLVLWHGYQGEQRDALEKVVEAWNARRPAGSPALAPVFVPFDECAERLASAIKRGEAPDLVVFAGDRVAELAAQGTIRELDGCVDGALRRELVPGALAAASHGGHVHGVPLVFQTMALLYDRKRVPHPPRTTAELVELSRKLTDRAAGRYGLFYPWWNVWYQMSLWHAFGGGPLDVRGEPALDAPGNVRAAELLLRWREAFLPPPLSPDEATQLFREGKAAMLIDGPWDAPAIRGAVDLAAAPLPAVSEAGGRPMRPFLTIHAVSIPRSARDPAVACTAAKALASRDAAVTLALGGLLPANTGAYRDPRVAADPVRMGFYRQALASVPYPSGRALLLSWEPLTDAWTAILRHEAAPGEALARAQARVKHVLALYRDGEALAKDPAQALPRYLEACDEGYGFACFQAGWLLQKGRGTAADPRRAAVLYERACDRLDSGGCTNLGLMYAHGEGVEKDLPRARALYEKACTDGLATGCNNLADLYETGAGVEKDLARAATLYEQACNLGSASACSSLGSLCERGEGVPADLYLAAKLYARACAAGHAKACQARDRLAKEAGPGAP